MPPETGTNGWVSGPPEFWPDTELVAFSELRSFLYLLLFTLTLGTSFFVRVGEIGWALAEKPAEYVFSGPLLTGLLLGLSFDTPPVDPSFLLAMLFLSKLRLLFCLEEGEPFLADIKSLVFLEVAFFVESTLPFWK